MCCESPPPIVVTCGYPNNRRDGKNDMEFYSSSSSNFIPNRIQQYNRVCMTNITNNRVIIDIVM